MCVLFSLSFRTLPRVSLCALVFFCFSTRKKNTLKNTSGKGVCMNERMCLEKESGKKLKNGFVSVFELIAIRKKARGALEM